MSAQGDDRWHKKEIIIDSMVGPERGNDPQKPRQCPGIGLTMGHDPRPSCQEDEDTQPPHVSRKEVLRRLFRLGRMGVAGDLFVVCRQRCYRIASSSLRDLISQDPSANVTVFLQGSTSPPRCCFINGLPVRGDNNLDSSPAQSLRWRSQLIQSGRGIGPEEATATPHGKVLTPADRNRSER